MGPFPAEATCYLNTTRVFADFSAKIFIWQMVKRLIYILKQIFSLNEMEVGCQIPL